MPPTAKLIDGMATPAAADREMPKVAEAPGEMLWVAGVTVTTGSPTPLLADVPVTTTSVSATLDTDVPDVPVSVSGYVPAGVDGLVAMVMVDATPVTGFGVNVGV